MSVSPIVKEARETSPLNHSEYSADLEEIDADEEKLIAADYSAGINGENPKKPWFLALMKWSQNSSPQRG